MNKDRNTERFQDEAERWTGSASTFTHPDEVLHDPGLSVSEKRRVLAAWASDAHAVPSLPAMRQLDSGAIVNMDVVLAALRTLDAQGAKIPKRRICPAPTRRFVGTWLGALGRRHRDDDDDPPPSPATALPPGLDRELRRQRDAACMPAAA